MLTLRCFKLQSFTPKHGNRRRERGCACIREEGNLKSALPSERGFPGQPPLTHRALALPAEPEAGRVYSEVWHVFIAEFCIMHLDTVSGAFIVCDPMEHTAVF